MSVMPFSVSVSITMDVPRKPVCSVPPPPSRTFAARPRTNNSRRGSSSSRVPRAKAFHSSMKKTPACRRGFRTSSATASRSTGNVRTQTSPHDLNCRISDATISTSANAEANCIIRRSCLAFHVGPNSSTNCNARVSTICLPYSAHLFPSTSSLIRRDFQGDPIDSRFGRFGRFGRLRSRGSRDPTSG